MAKNKFKNIKQITSQLKKMGESIQPAFAYAIIEDFAEPIVYRIKAGISTNGVPPSAYGIIKKNDTKYITKERVSLLMGIDYSDVDAYKLNWMEYGTNDRYTKRNYFRGKITARPTVRPILDSSERKLYEDIRDAFAEEIIKLGKENGFTEK